MRTALLIPLLIVLLGGCDQLPGMQRYQLLASPDGQVYRLDAKTGAVDYVTPDGMFSLSEATPKLKQGQYFQLEDGKFLKYIGNGQFEKSDYAVRRVK
jgi:hypothetical protein